LNHRRKKPDGAASLCPAYDPPVFISVRKAFWKSPQRAPWAGYGTLFPDKPRRLDRRNGGWLVLEGVAATDLSQRGRDDRAIALYFVFSQVNDAAQSPLAQLTGGSAHALIYVFGGKHARGSVVSSPHLQSRGKFIVLRPADSPRHQWLSESVDLADDYKRVFGAEKPPLIAVAISSDSDDTRGRNLARLRRLSTAP
jgi:hypothetical protein